MRRIKVGAVGKDVAAGAIHGLVSLPDGLASGLLAGLSPISGLYGYLIGTVAGALSTSSVLMSIQGTGAMAVIIADTAALHSGEDPGRQLATLGVMTGIVMLALGLFKLGSLLRFVPNAVITGFVGAVAINIILGQLSAFTGFSSNAGNRLFRAINTLANVASFDWPTVIIGALTIGLIIVLEKTPLKSLGLFVAVAATSGLAVLPFFDSVRVVSDIAAIPGGLPSLSLPSIGMVGGLLVPALSLAFVGLVQGGAISQSIPNPDGKYPDVSGDFRGQGVANIASGLLSGTPVGGSMSGTAVLIAAGARSRVANLVAGAVMILVILLFSNLAGYIAMPSLAGLLILVGARMFKPQELLMVARTGPTQAVVMAVTFALTIVIPMQYAVVIGVGISVILFVVEQSTRIRVSRWRFTEGPLPTEEKPPAVLPAAEVVVLNVSGSLFFASAALFTEQLPAVEPESSHAVVVVRLRGEQNLGSTVIQALLRYKAELDAVEGHLLLTGVGVELITQLEATKAMDELGRENIFAATKLVGESLAAGVARAKELVAPFVEPPEIN